MNALLNITAVDELAAIREEIKQLETREATLRAFLLNGSDDDRDGKQYRAFIQESKRETVDKASMIAALGRDVVEPFIKTTAVKTLKLAKKE
jgi:hypothetical protein